MTKQNVATCPNCKDQELITVFYNDNKEKYRCMKCNLIFDEEQIGTKIRGEIAPKYD